MSITVKQRARHVFMEVADLAPLDREAALVEACAGDTTLRAEVDALLRAEAEAGGFMASPTAQDDALELIPTSAAICGVAGIPQELPGQMIGRYKLLEPIGEGGFGSVWMAEQREPMKRRVALKIIKLGMDTKQVIARFEAERQALAMMDHPNIAKVLDAGSTEIGRPYFVMEYIRGIPIVEYCDIEKLDTRTRLGLFSSVCHAIQHAHTKGIIHRDIKPSNVLVTMHDGVPVPKVIDFGIAKATTAELTQKTLFTEHRQMIGTPAYMSPEQAETSGLDIDTRSDIYSLGVLLYELLTGTTPFDSKQLRAAALGEIQRIIREVDPPKPSTRLSTMKDMLAIVALRRQCEPAKLARTMQGDLDWIVMKSLEKDRTRRYETASALAADVHRHLVGEPVIAAPPSHVYRLSKTLRRHQTSAAVATILILVIAGALVATSVLWRQSARARDSESDQRARAEAINTFLTEMLTAAEPAKAKGAKLTVRETLDAAARRVDEGSFKDQPLVEAEIRMTIGSTYAALGLNPEARAQFQTADALQSRELGEEHPATLRARFNLARTLVATDYASCTMLAQATLETQRRVLGPDHLDTLRSMVLLGVVQGYAGRFAEAESLLLAAIERRERSLGPNHAGTAYFMNRLGSLYLDYTYPDKAEPLHREAMRIQTQALGKDHPDTISSMQLLASSLRNQARSAEAEAMSRSALEVCTRILGPEHKGTLALQADLASALSNQGRHVEAEPIFRETLTAQVRILGPTDYDTITTQRWFADCLLQQRNYPEAETILRDALGAAVEKYGLEGNTPIRLMCALADVLEKRHKDADAEQVARQVLEFQHRQLPRANPDELTKSSFALIRVLQRRGSNDEALRVEQELIESWLAAARQPDASASMIQGASLRLLYPACEELRDAPQALELALQANERSGQRNPRHLNTLAQAYMLTGDSEHATQVWKQAIARLPDDQARTVMLNSAAWELLTVTPETRRNPTAALEFALKANDLSQYGNPAQLDTLALAYFRTGDTPKAIQFQNQALNLLPQDDLKRSEYEDQLAEFEAAFRIAQ